MNELNKGSVPLRPGENVTFSYVHICKYRMT